MSWSTPIRSAHESCHVIGKTMLIHVGASLNYFGKKCIDFSALARSTIPDILATIWLCDFCYATFAMLVKVYVKKSVKALKDNGLVTCVETGNQQN